jgi:signal transduction histidine kinase
MSIESFSRFRLRELLAAQPLFADMSDATLETMLDGAEEVKLTTGETLVDEGDPAMSVFFIVDGSLEVYRMMGSQTVPLGARKSGDVVGEMGVLTGMPRNATMRASTPSIVLSITGAAFMSALHESPGALMVVVRIVTQRLKGAEAELVQHQKMAALGILAAGLAHELNNPASALKRSADRLKDAVASWEACAEELGASGLVGTDEAILSELRAEMATGADGTVWDPVDRSDRIQELQRWLAEHRIDRSWEHAPALVDAGFRPSRLVALEDRVGGEAFPVLTRWISAGANVLSHLRTMEIGSAAISDIVAGVKAYTRLDQAPIQDVDIHESLEQSLTMLRYHLRSVAVHRRYTDVLPGITAFASELNQVWTNLITNAVDAMKGAGDLTIRTSCDGQWVSVEFEDTGVGIPTDVKSRLFEPFFTTKPPGEGTGMGLAISYSIVQRHGGDIRATSRPGQTRFTIRLPIAGVAS